MDNQSLIALLYNLHSVHLKKNHSHFLHIFSHHTIMVSSFSIWRNATHLGKIIVYLIFLGLNNWDLVLNFSPKVHLFAKKSLHWTQVFLNQLDIPAVLQTNTWTDKGQSWVYYKTSFSRNLPPIWSEQVRPWISGQLFLVTSRLISWKNN